MIGAGFTGGQLARTFVAEGCTVVLIDRDAERVRQARNQLDCTVIQSDGNSLAVLEEAGIGVLAASFALAPGAGFDTLSPGRKLYAAPDGPAGRGPSCPPYNEHERCMR